MTEAEKPRPLEEHLQRARDVHAKLVEFARDSAGVQSVEVRLTRDEQLAKLRAGAREGFWLYPVVEARLGVPR